MSNRTIRGRTVASAAAVAAAVGVAGFAFTAGNTVPATRAGDGTNEITGYTVSAVHYTLDSADPDLIDAVSFDVDTAPVAGSTLRAQLVDGGAWYTCTFSGVAVSCPTTTPQATVLASEDLRVVIAQ